MNQRPVLIMAGGTGGHVFPALSVAKVFARSRRSGVWLAVPGSMESRLVPANVFSIELVRVKGIRGKGSTAWLIGALQNCKRGGAGHGRACAACGRAPCWERAAM